MQMGIEGDDELGSRDPFPTAGINGVLTYHPPQEKVESFTGASPFWKGDKMPATSV